MGKKKSCYRRCHRTDLSFQFLRYMLVKHMIQGLYGAVKTRSLCMKNGKWDHDFPKQFLLETEQGQDSYPKYRRWWLFYANSKATRRLKCQNNRFVFTTPLLPSLHSPSPTPVARSLFSDPFLPFHESPAPSPACFDSPHFFTWTHYLLCPFFSSFFRLRIFCPFHVCHFHLCCLCPFHVYHFCCLCHR